MSIKELIDAVPVKPYTAAEADKFTRAPCGFCGYNGPNYFQPKAHPCAAHWHSMHVTPLAVVRAQLALAVALLDDYVVHKPTCDIYQGIGAQHPCTCGLDAGMKKLKETP